jgi:hypothetical protein
VLLFDLHLSSFEHSEQLRKGLVIPCIL